jgi:hypothetical protein
VTDGRRAGAGGHQEGVAVAVVAAVELDEPVAAGGGPGQAQGRHGGLGAGVDQPHHVHRRQGLGDQLRQVGLGGGGGAEGGAPLDRGAHRLDDRRVAVAQDVGPVGADVVQVASTVLGLQVRPAGGAHEDRLAADPGEGPDRRGDAAGHDAAGAFVELVRSGIGHGIDSS